MKIKFWIRRLFLIFFGLFTSLISLEVAFRQIGLGVRAHYEEMTWFAKSTINQVPYLLKPSQQMEWGEGEIRTNAIGLRDEHFLPKIGDDFRILMLGDSITFGQGVAQNNTVPAILESDLRSVGDRKNVQVINAGIPGFNLMDESALLPSLLRGYHPDVVVWTLISNDFDDSFGINDKGQLSFSDGDFVISAEPLSAFGITGDSAYLGDLSLSMPPDKLAWAKGVPYHPGYLNEFFNKLGNYSALINWIALRLPQISNERRFVKGSSLTRLRSKFTDSEGVTYNYPKFSPAFLSPRVINRGEVALKAGIDSAAAASVPMLVFNTLLPLDDDLRLHPINYHYAEASSYLGMPILQLFRDYNLKWDAHLNPMGNRLLARAIEHALNCAKLITLPGFDCNDALQYDYRMIEFWNSFKHELHAFAQNTFSDIIDFDRFIGFQQILGGVFPPREFPGSDVGRANFLFKDGGGSNFELEISGPSSGTSEVEVSLFTDTTLKTKIINIATGSNRYSIEVPPHVNHGFVELQLKCLKKPCPTMKLHSIKVIDSSDSSGRKI